MGMLVLFVLLQTKVYKATWLDKASDFLLDNLVFFFIPATAGVALIPFIVIKQDALVIIISSVVSSVLVLLVVGLITDKFEKRDERRNNT
jgi:holin-like protein